MYIYSTQTPYFGDSGFTCMPPAANTTKSDRKAAYASSRVDSINRSLTSSSRQSSFSRSDSLSNSNANSSFSRTDSLSSRPTLTRMESLGRANPGTVTSSSEYSIGADGRPSAFSSTSYKSPYPGNSFRMHSHF